MNLEQPDIWRNVVEVRNYLAHERTRWFGSDAGVEPGLLAEIPEFIAHRFGGPCLFRLPHDDVWLYCGEDSKELDWSFRVAVAEHDLSGLTFQEIWNSEAGGRRPSSVPGVSVSASPTAPADATGACPPSPGTRPCRVAHRVRKRRAGASPTGGSIAG